MRRVNLREAELGYTVMINTDISEANCRGASFHKANTAGVQFRRTLLDETSEVPGIRVTGEKVIG
jgi:uncharacterized protein YjbI with pentapeptide repeats